MTPDQIARIAYEADRAYKRALLIEDLRQPWDDAPRDYRAVAERHAAEIMSGTYEPPVPVDDTREALFAAIVSALADDGRFQFGTEPAADGTDAHPHALRHDRPVHAEDATGGPACGDVAGWKAGQPVTKHIAEVDCPNCLPRVAELYQAVTQQAAREPGTRQLRRPRIGAPVHYVSYGTPGGEYPSVCRAAIITAVLGAPAPYPPVVSLCVLNPEGQFFNQSINHDPGLASPEPTGMCTGRKHGGGTWHWPAEAPQ